jgi:magnesium transporter
MRKKVQSSKLTWLDIQKPGKKDIEHLKKQFGFHPLVLDELIHPGLRPKVEHYQDYLYLILYYPVYNTPIKNLFEGCKLYRRNRKAYMSEGTGQLLYYVLSSFWENCLTKLVQIDKRIANIEKEMFSGKEKEMVLEVSLVKTDIINFWRIVEPQRQVLNSLLKEGIEFFGKDLSPHFSDFLGTYEQVANGIESQKQTVLALEDTNQSLLTTRINEIMRVLTSFSVILLPLTLIASVWGMNFPKSLPFFESQNGFWIIMGVMFISSLILLAYFRKKKWL